MMNIGPAEAGALTYWQYTAMRHVWNERHSLDGEADDDIAAPDLDYVLARQAELAELGISGKVH